MSRYEFSLATPADEPALRARMAQDTLKGAIEVSFRREPDYFRGCALQGDQYQVIRCKDTTSDRVVALGSRLTLTAFLNGQPTRLGYLSDLRGEPGIRGGTLLARGYRFLKSLHTENPVPCYYSVILEGNQIARRNLLGNRAGLPVYRSLGRILTPAVHLDLPKPQLQLEGITVIKANETWLPRIFAFIKQQHARYQLAPCFQAEDFGTARLAGLKPEDIYLAIRGDRLVGTLAAWDQGGIRQTHVEAYSPTLKKMRPFYNALAAITPLKPLPAPGERIPYFYLALAATDHDDPKIFALLLRTLYNERRRGPWSYFIGGFHEHHPLAATLMGYRHIKAAGELFLVHYPEQSVELDQRIAHVEIATV